MDVLKGFYRVENGKKRMLDPASSKKDFDDMWGAIKYFMQRPAVEAGQIRAKVQELATAGQFPEQVAEQFEKFKIGNEQIDTAWQLAFSEVDLNGTNASSYEIFDVKNAITFEEIPVGGRTTLYSLTGEKTSIEFPSYGAGLQIPKAWYDDQKLWNITERAEDFTLAHYEKQANIFYQMIEALTGESGDADASYNIPYQSGADSVSLEDDIKTINAGVVSLMEGLKNSGIRVTLGSPLVLLCPLKMFDRCSRAVKATQGVSYQGAEAISANITVVPTLGITKASSWCDSDSTTLTTSTVPLGYLIYPGAKNKFIRREDLTIYEPEFSTRTRTTNVNGWSRYGGSFNMEQARRLLPAYPSS